MSATGEIVAVRPKGCPSYNSTSPCPSPMATCAQWPAEQAVNVKVLPGCLPYNKVNCAARARHRPQLPQSPHLALPCLALPRCSKSRAKTRVCHIKFPCQLAATCAAQWHQLWQTCKNQLQFLVTSCRTRFATMHSCLTLIVTRNIV